MVDSNSAKSEKHSWRRRDPIDTWPMGSDGGSRSFHSPWRRTAPSKWRSSQSPSPVFVTNQIFSTVRRCRRDGGFKSGEEREAQLVAARLDRYVADGKRQRLQIFPLSMAIPTQAASQQPYRPPVQSTLHPRFPIPCPSKIRRRKELLPISIPSQTATSTVAFCFSFNVIDSDSRTLNDGDRFQMERVEEARSL
ncbi:unnamed protein product [Linum trigynum]|uniref:Uncharacterized protein n=1 Tax=Linum trigynum TaxID=586398 RepID=A0AAV2D915_9ROSI